MIIIVVIVLIVVIIVKIVVPPISHIIRLLVFSCNIVEIKHIIIKYITPIIEDFHTRFTISIFFRYYNESIFPPSSYFFLPFVLFLSWLLLIAFPGFGLIDVVSLSLIAFLCTIFCLPLLPLPLLP